MRSINGNSSNEQPSDAVGSGLNEMFGRLVGVAMAAVFVQGALAQTEASAPLVLPSVEVIGKRERLPDIAGAGQIVDEEELENSRVFTVNEALRRVPGVVMRDEEGFGLRPNISIRGLNPTRSTKITLLEDGLPLSYAPYGDNATYFHPQIDRYARVEVLKGASSLLYGPQTIGGIVNYVMPTPPRDFSGYVQGALGNRDYFNGKVRLGGGGFLADYSRKQGDGARDNMNHQLDDLNLIYALNFAGNHALKFRGSYYREDSKITYSGLTQAEFDRLGPRYNPFKNDEFETKRLGASVTHEWDFGNGSMLLTSLYYSKFDRDWWRQASNSQDAQCGAAFNAARIAGTQVDPDTCNSTQGRLRSYYNAGIEPRLKLVHGLGEFQAGVKFHVEEQDRQQVNASSPTGRSGTVTEDNLRETKAWSVFVANRFDFGNFSVQPILRHESIEVDRRNRLTDAQGGAVINKTLPGLGVTWNPTKKLTVFTSVHKGFAPPRVEDLIGGTGTVTEVEAESSTNFEIGVRSQPAPGINLQAAVFRNDFDNLIAVGSIAGGNTPLSEGEAIFQGLEFGAQAEFLSGFFGRVAYTHLQEATQEQPFRNVANGTIANGSEAGKRQPYAPKHALTAAAGYEIGPLRGELELQYVSEQFSDFANTNQKSADGQRGEIDAFTVFNLALNYKIRDQLTAFFTVKNIADRNHIVERTRGIQVGMPRLIQAGIRYSF
jgi:Fe(3+) dicitrate transport protein